MQLFLWMKLGGDDNMSPNFLMQTYLYQDMNLKMKNFNKYRQDRERNLIDKICMIQIENATLLVGHMGQDMYYEYIKSLVDDIKVKIEGENSQALNYNFYAIGFDTFVIGAGSEISEGKFIDDMEYLHRLGETSRENEERLMLLHRFVVVVNQNNMIGCAHNQFYLHRDTQVGFIISDGAHEIDTSTEDDLKVIEMINYAIQNDKVIPYYQGIYDNKMKRIDKYEALMRIEDKDGNIHLPCEFLALSKKYRLYIELTRMMLNRVLQEFQGSKFPVSVNISAIDLNSAEMKQVLIEKILESKEPDKIIFEILEDEGFRDISVLKEFMKEVQGYGVKIGIDDFGSGYSNLLELMKIRPDFLKLDGEIVKAMALSPESKLIVEAVVMVAKKLNMEVIAEFVEDLTIQKEVEDLKIEFSQGYYFAKPLPFEKLGL